MHPPHMHPLLTQQVRRTVRGEVPANVLALLATVGETYRQHEAALAQVAADGVRVTQTGGAERERAEAALLAAEEKYRDMFHNATDGIFQTTAEGRYIACNPSLARIYGYASPEDLINSITDIQHSL